MIGVGFNYAFFQADPEGRTLPIHPAVGFVELGISEMNFLSEQGILLPLTVSLHLARTPITESEDSQDRFIEYLSPLVATYRKKYDICSIGLHLIGSRFSGMGLLGFSEPYKPSPSRLRLATRFVTRLQSACEIPVWIENANLYVETADDVLSSWEHVKQLCDEAGTRIIFDVADAVVEATNVGLTSDIDCWSLEEWSPIEA